jgi:UDP-N-acetylglucosamine 2-epimerase
MARKKLAIILGIRPDVIRASLVLNSIRMREDIDVQFIWSGQHYSDNLKDVFFRWRRFSSKKGAHAGRRFRSKQRTGAALGRQHG